MMGRPECGGLLFLAERRTSTKAGGREREDSEQDICGGRDGRRARRRWRAEPSLSLQLRPLLPRSAPSRHRHHHHQPRAAAASPARVSAGAPRRRASNLRCCAAGDQGEPPQDSVLKAISQVASSKGRVALTTNVVMGGTVTDDATDKWLVLDKKVNSYPTVREFTAIGIGGDDFVDAMVVAVESVLQESIPKGQISQKVSSKGKYISVKIGPLRVVSSEQVQAVYNSMKKDDRMKFFL